MLSMTSDHTLQSVDVLCPSSGDSAARSPWLRFSGLLRIALKR